MSETQNNQPILDHEGRDLREVAEEFYASHKDAVVEQRNAENHDTAIRAARGAIEQALATDDEQDPGAKLAANNIKNGLTDELDEAEKYYVADDINAIEESVEEGREHYEKNTEVYQQAAIEDATAAGHDINFGGRTLPSTANRKIN